MTKKKPEVITFTGYGRHYYLPGDNEPEQVVLCAPRQREDCEVVVHCIKALREGYSVKRARKVLQSRCKLMELRLLNERVR